MDPGHGTEPPAHDQARVHVAMAVLRWPPETFLRWQLEGLAELGARVTVLATVPRRGASMRLPGIELVAMPDHGESPVWRLPGVAAALVRLALRHPRRLRRLVAAALRERPRGSGRHGLAPVLRRLHGFVLLADRDPDVVHFAWQTVAARYLDMVTAWGSPFVVSCRGSDLSVYPHVPGHQGWASRLPAVLGRATAVHCVSESMRAEAAALGADRARAWLIHPAVDTEFFSPAETAVTEPPASAPPLRVMSCSDLLWGKGLEYGLSAVRCLLDRGVGVRWHVVGDVRADYPGSAEERERILATIDDLGLGDHVTMHGRLEPVAVRDLLRRCDALLHPSLAEGISNAVLEAMACGLPVVVSDCGGMREAVTDGEQGFVVPVRSPDAMADALGRLSADSQLRERMGRAGRRRAQERFELSDQVSRLLAMYRQTAGLQTGETW